MLTEAQANEQPAAAIETAQAAARGTPEAPGNPEEVFETGRAGAIAKIEAMRAERAAGKATPAPVAQEAGSEVASEASGQASGQEAGENKEAAEGEKKPEAAATEPDEAKAAAELLAAARENRALIAERRRLAERDAAIKAREKELASAVVPERETVAKLMKARESNDPIEVLRAAGYSDKDVSTFALSLIDRMGKVQGEEEEEAPKPPTAEEVAALVQKQAEEKAAAQAKEAEAARVAQMQAMRNDYFGKLSTEFKSNAKDYPVLAAIQPTFAQLEESFVEHFNRTGERLTPQQLLVNLEKQYGGRGLTLAPKKPAPSAPSATAKTVGAAATSDGGPVVMRDEGKSKQPRDMHDVHAEGRDAVVKEIERRRAAKRATR